MYVLFGVYFVSNLVLAVVYDSFKGQVLDSLSSPLLQLIVYSISVFPAVGQLNGRGGELKAGSVECGI
jgi:hypothetical protein